MTIRTARSDPFVTALRGRTCPRGVSLPPPAPSRCDDAGGVSSSLRRRVPRAAGFQQGDRYDDSNERIQDAAPVRSCLG
jgi:hypothetical protein